MYTFFFLHQKYADFSLRACNNHVSVCIWPWSGVVGVEFFHSRNTFLTYGNYKQPLYACWIFNNNYNNKLTTGVDLLIKFLRWIQLSSYNVSTSNVISKFLADMYNIILRIRDGPTFLQYDRSGWDLLCSQYLTLTHWRLHASAHTILFTKLHVWTGSKHAVIGGNIGYTVFNCKTIALD